MQSMMLNAYDNLYRYQGDPPKIVPWLAESHTVSEDGLNWEFKLRPGVKFHDGSDFTAEDAVFTCDVGTPIIWTARYLKVNGRRRIIGSFNHGSMANGMLQAIGAQAAYPQRQVISMSGDGGFSMMMGDFITLTQMGLPVKVVVLNNGTLGFVEMEMKANGFLDTGCDLKNPNFALMAEAVGVRGIRVERPQELKAALETAFAQKGPVLVDVVSARQELAMPPKTTLDQAYHFGMFTMKAVLDGRVSQLIDLAKVNLTR